MTQFKLVFGMCMLVLVLGATCLFAQTPEDAKAKAKEFISATDTDKDGQISKEEYLAKCKGANCSQRFDALDTNKDGFLNKEEAQQKAATAKEKGAALKEKVKMRGQQPAN